MCVCVCVCVCVFVFMHTCAHLSECAYFLMTNVPVFKHVIYEITKCCRNIKMLLNKFVIRRIHSYRVLSINVSYILFLNTLISEQICDICIISMLLRGN